MLLFRSLETQWRMSYGGPSGLDYTAIEPAFRLMKVPKPEWPELFGLLREMELAALDQMRINTEAATAARDT